MERVDVLGGDGVRIALRVAGSVGMPPIVFVHGWAQSAGAWFGQLESDTLAERFRLVAMDLRGHGCSAVAEAGYDDSRAWADDLAAVLRYVGEPAVLVGWSYGGLVIADYLRWYGEGGVAGLVLAGAITEIGRNRPGGVIGPAMRAALPDALAEDAGTAVSALSTLCSGMSTETVPGSLTQALLGSTLAVPPAVRAALFRRDVDNAAVLASVALPTLVLHGTEDTVVDPTVAQYTAGKISGARLRWMDGVGHLPFIERPMEFDSMLRQFADERRTA